MLTAVYSMCYVNSLQLHFKGRINVSCQTSYDITVGEVSGCGWMHDTTGFTSRTARMKNTALLLGDPGQKHLKNRSIYRRSLSMVAFPCHQCWLVCRAGVHKRAAVGVLPEAIKNKDLCRCPTESASGMRRSAEDGGRGTNTAAGNEKRREGGDDVYVLGPPHRPQPTSYSDPAAAPDRGRTASSAPTKISQE